MFKRTNVVLTSFILVAMLLAPIAPVQAKLELDEGSVNLLDAKGNSIRFEVRVPIDELLIEAVELDGENYSRIGLQGFDNISQVAAPQLPIWNEVIGAPFDSEVAITVVPGRAQRIALNAPVSPVMTESVDFSVDQPLSGDFTGAASVFTYPQDPEIYEQMPSFPSVYAEITNDGIMRSQRLVSIAVYPVQYDIENQELVVYESLEVRLEFGGQNNRVLLESVEEADSFESFFQNNVLNYDQAKNWRNSQLTKFQLTDTAWTPPTPGYRLYVRETGLYKISFVELANLGIPIASIDHNTLKIFNQGTEIAIRVIPADGIVFYGVAEQTKYSADNVYWLTYGGSSGLRMQSIDGSPTTAPTPLSFQYVEHFENDVYYRGEVIDIDDYDHYLWSFVRKHKAQVTNEIVQVYNFDHYIGGDLGLNIKLFGLSEVDGLSTDHLAQVKVNDELIAEERWKGYNQSLIETTIPVGMVTEGAINLKLTTSEAPFDGEVYYLDWLEFNYQRDFGAVGNKLPFSYEAGEWTFLLTGFDNNSNVVYDISNPASPKTVSNAQIGQNNGKYTIKFSDSLSSPKQYFASDANTFLAVSKIEADSPSNLRSQAHGADLLLISHHILMDPAEELAPVEDLKTHKIAMGLRTEVIDVQDIYDEFNYGIPSPYAIQSFIAYAYQHWQAPAPAYVILIGDGHFDPKNNQGLDRQSLIPPFLLHVDGEIGETAADNRYAAVVGDDILPDLMLGRISANTVAEAQAHIDKIIAYETNPPDGDWKHRILAVTDKPEIAHYPHMSEALLDEYFPSEPFHAERVYWGWNYTDLNQAQATIKNEMNNGVFLVNYIGHGAYQFWGKFGNLFGIDDIQNLQANSSLAVVLAMTCMEGYYVSPNKYSAVPKLNETEALAELVTRAEGKGAVASWSPTGWGAVIGHDYTNRGFLKAVYQDGVNILGQATHAGLLRLWQSGRYLDLIDTTLLFGDPSMKLQTQLTAIYDEYELESNTTLTVSAAEGVLANDINPTGNPVNAVLVENVQNGNLTLNSDGSFFYTPNANFHGFDSFRYKVKVKVGEDGEESNTVPVYLYIGAIPNTNIYLPLVRR